MRRTVLLAVALICVGLTLVSNIGCSRRPSAATDTTPAVIPVDCYGDPLPGGVLARMGSVPLAEGGHTIAFSPDGKRLAVASGFGITFRDALTGKELKKVDKPGNNYFIFSPDGKICITDHYSDKYHFWDAETGEEKFSYPSFGSQGPTGGLIVSKDGTLFAHSATVLTVLADGRPDFKSTLYVREVSTGKTLYQLDGERSFSFAPDGTLVTARGTTVTFHEARSGNVLRQFVAKDTDKIETLRVSADGATVITLGSDVLRSVRFWDAASGKQLRSFDRGQPILSADGRSMALVHGKTVEVWDLAADARPHTLEEPLDFPTQPPVFIPLTERKVALSPDGKTLAIMCSDSRLGIWDVASGERLLPRGHFSGINAVAVAPNGSTIASASWDGTVRIWDSGSGKELHCLQAGRGVCLAYSPDSRTLATGLRENIVTWDVAGGNKILKFEAAPGITSLKSIAFSPDGKTLVSGGTNEAWLGLSDAGTGKLLWKTAEPHGTFQSAFMRDGKTIVSLHIPQWEQRFITIRDAATGKELSRQQSFRDMNTQDLSSDGNFLVWQPFNRPQLSVWDIRAGKAVFEEGRHEYNSLRGLAISPDGSTVAARFNTGPRDDILVWDVASGQLVCQFGNVGSFGSLLGFTPDGKALVSDQGSTLLLRSLPSASQRAGPGQAFPG